MSLLASYVFQESLICKQVFERILKAYATKLFAKLPKGGTGIVAAATGMDGQIKVLIFYFYFFVLVIDQIKELFFFLLYFFYRSLSNVGFFFPYFSLMVFSCRHLTGMNV